MLGKPIIFFIPVFGPEVIKSGQGVSADAHSTKNKKIFFSFAGIRTQLFCIKSQLPEERTKTAIYIKKSIEVRTMVSNPRLFKRNTQ